MKLADYLAREKIKPTAFAGRLNVPASTITRLLRGERSPSFEVMRKIAEETKNEASTIDDFNPPTRASKDDARGAAA